MGLWWWQSSHVLSLFIPSLTLQSDLIHYLGLSHPLLAMNFIFVSLGKKSAWSARVKVTDTDFDGVEVRVFEGPPKPEEPLKRSVVFVHGGGWALASASMSWSPSGCLGLRLAPGGMCVWLSLTFLGKERGTLSWLLWTVPVSLIVSGKLLVVSPFHTQNCPDLNA